MLQVFDDKNPHVRQQLSTGQKADRIFKAVTFLDTVATDNQRDLILYTRVNSSGINEAGIYYVNSNGGGEATQEVLRFFSRNKKCFSMAQDHYAKLVEREALKYVDFMDIL